MTKPKTIAPTTIPNQIQRKYAIERVNQIAKLLSTSIKDDCERNKHEVPSLEEKCLMIREGKAILQLYRVKPLNRYNIPDIIEVHEFPAEVEILRHNEEIDRVCQERLTALNARASEIRDHIMLGNDADEALRLIAEFSESKF